MKEPVWELGTLRMWMGEAEGVRWLVMLTLAGQDPISPIFLHKEYTRPWSARRGGYRWGARNVKGTIRERSK